MEAFSGTHFHTASWQQPVAELCAYAGAMTTTADANGTARINQRLTAGQPVLISVPGYKGCLENTRSPKESPDFSAAVTVTLAGRCKVRIRTSAVLTWPISAILLVCLKHSASKSDTRVQIRLHM